MFFRYESTKKKRNKQTKLVETSLKRYENVAIIWLGKRKCALACVFKGMYCVFLTQSNALSHYSVRISAEIHRFVVKLNERKQENYCYVRIYLYICTRKVNIFISL